MPSQNGLDALRTELRSRCELSFYTFCKLVLGYRDMTPSLHGRLCDYMSLRRQHKLIVLPRGHLKTSICTIGYALWRLLQEPNIRILIANATATNAAHFLRNIAAILETNQLVRWLWPEVVPEDTSKVKWTETEIEVARTRHHPESTVEAIGVGGTVVSRHYDLIIEDDLLAPQDGVLTAEGVQRVIEWHKYATSLFASPALGEQVIVGTRWLHDDFIAYLFDHERWFLPAFYRKVYDSEGRPIWPERFPPEVLDRILEQQGPRIFSSQYLNDPVHEDPRSFDPAWFRFWERLPQQTIAVTAIDPALSQKKHGDFSAIVTVAADAERNRYVVDARRGRWGVDELIDHIFQVAAVWKPVRIGLEAVAFQRVLVHPIREAMRRHGVSLPLVELQPSTRVTKEGRIATLHEYFANGSLWLHRSQADLLVELRSWPAVTHDDLLDALAYAMQLLVYPSTSSAKPPREDPLSADALIAWILRRGRQEPWGVRLGGLPTAEEVVEWMHGGHSDAR